MDGELTQSVSIVPVLSVRRTLRTEAFEKRTGQLVDDVDNILLIDAKKIALVHDAEGDIDKNVVHINLGFGDHALLSFVFGLQIVPPPSA